MGYKVKPITPQQAVQRKQSSIPDKVIKAFNDLITKNITPSGTANVKQKDILKELERLGFHSEKVFTKGWLNIEPIFREAGWDVEYDKPAYNEDYDPVFKFSQKESD